MQTAVQTGGVLCIRQDGAAADDRSAAGGAVGQAGASARGRAEPRRNEAASRKTEVELSVFEAGRKASRQGDRLVPKTRV